MNRKWAALGTTLVAALLVAASLTTADEDEDSPLHKVMEKVQTNNATIVKGVRTAVAYKKSQAEVAKAAEALVKLSKEARDLGEGPAKAQKKTVAEWQKLDDDWIKESTDFAAVVTKSDTTQVQAKDAFKKVTKSCTACHEVFRVEE